ncbi:type 2 isopentenyl-diphosphate Delta-isomerase [Mycolicibacterium boenickei]
MIADRKNEHVSLALNQHNRGPLANDFDAVTFIHHALDGLGAGEVSLGADFAGLSAQVPIFINAMTGGSEETGILNRQLAIAARETGLPIAAGSMSAYFSDCRSAETYRVLRQENPSGIVMANINATTPVDLARRAVDLLEANALQIHLNSVQEIVMPEGDRSFGSWPRRIEQIVAAIEVPVVVKEVGFGLSRRTVEWLRDAGVAAADVGGTGGTNFARIENSRRASMDYSFITGWGQSTAACLLDAAGVTGIDLVGSGGVRSPLDVARGLALGASTVGVAGYFLKILIACGTEALISTIRTWTEQLCQIMTVLGVRSPADFANTDLLVTGELEAYCRLRRIDPAAYSARSSVARAALSSGIPDRVPGNGIGIG